MASKEPTRRQATSQTKNSEGTAARRRAQNGPPKDAPNTATATSGFKGKDKLATPPGSKKSRVLALLKRPNGAGLKELVGATGWQPHSIRGFLSGTVTKKMGLTVRSFKTASGERRYVVKS